MSGKILQRASYGRANLQPHARGERGGQANARAENLYDERVAGFDDLNLAPDAKAERFEALNLLAIGLYAANNGTSSRRKFIQPRLADNCRLHGLHFTVILACGLISANRILSSFEQLLLGR
jgi:hypothetical protein